MDETASFPIPDESVPLSPAGRGTNPTGVRLYNERVILSLIRRHRALGKIGRAHV